MKKIFFLLALCFTLSMTFANIDPPEFNDDHPVIVQLDNQSQQVEVNSFTPNWQNTSTKGFARITHKGDLSLTPPPLKTQYPTYSMAGRCSQ